MTSKSLNLPDEILNGSIVGIHFMLQFIQNLSKLFNDIMEATSDHVLDLTEVIIIAVACLAHELHQKKAMFMLSTGDVLCLLRNRFNLLTNGFNTFLS